MVRRGFLNSAAMCVHGLPPGERPDEEADRETDAPPAVRQERLEVARPITGVATTMTPTTSTTSKLLSTQLHAAADPHAEEVRPRTG